MPAADRTPSHAVVTVTRTFAAPRDLVFRACTEAPLMSQWFARGPEMPEGKILELDPRPGGRYLIEVVSNMDGRTYRMQGTFREVNRPSRVSFTWWYDLADFDESLVTIDLRDAGTGRPSSRSRIRSCPIACSSRIATVGKSAWMRSDRHWALGRA